jgi:hypothetical protein
MDPTSEDELGDRLDHVARLRLPWRTTDLTECGRDADKFPTITADQYEARLRKYGQRRTAFTVCQTCVSRVTFGLPGTAGGIRNGIIDALHRECERVRYDPNSQLEQELQAIAALIDAHRLEFDATLAGLDDITHLGARRAATRGRRIKR